MAYWLYKRKGWSPYDYLKKPFGEKIIIRGFVMQEVEDIKAEADAIKAMEEG